MRKRNKPFVVYRRGPGSFTIVPRGLIGWAQFAVWIGLPVPLIVLFFDYAGHHAQGENFAAAVMLVGFGVFSWVILGIWWMYARAEVVEMAEHIRSKQIEAQKRRRQG